MTIPRLLPDQPFPPYAFVPGRFPHPVSDPAGHSFGQEPVPTPLDPARWWTCRPYLFGLDLFNGGFFWEAHTQWECVWLTTRPRPGLRSPAPTAQLSGFLKGLIRLAAAGVKIREGNLRGVASHTAAAADRFAQTAAVSGADGRYLGLALADLLTMARSASQLRTASLGAGPVFGCYLVPLWPSVEVPP
jgi:uncharacterized protein